MKTLTSVVGLAAAALVSCSNGGFSAGSGPFVGSWTCTGTDALTPSKPAGAQPVSNPTSSTRTVVDNGDGTITSTSMNDAGATCVLKSTVSGSMTTLESGQTCVSKGITLSFTSGMGSVSGTTLTVSASFTYSGSATTDGGTAVQVAGTGTTSSTCMKQ